MRALCMLLFMTVCAQVYVLSTRENPIPLDRFMAIEESMKSAQSQRQLLAIHHELLQAVKDQRTDQAVYELGVFYAAYGYPRAAASAFDYIRQSNAAHFEAHYAYANIAAVLGHLDIAYQGFEEAARIADHELMQAECYYRLGLLALRQEDAVLAAGAFESALQTTDYPAARLELAKLALAQADEDRFYRHYNVLREHYAMATEVYHLTLRAEEAGFAVPSLVENDEREIQLTYDYSSSRDAAIRQDFGVSINEIESLAERGNHQAPNELALRKQSRDLSRIENGQKLFKQAQCTMCHGEHAQGNIAPNLRDDYWIYGSDMLRIVESISDGRKHNHMPAQKHLLGATEIEDLAIYIAHLNRQKDQAGGKAVEGKKSDGTFNPITY